MNDERGRLSGGTVGGREIIEILYAKINILLPSGFVCLIWRQGAPIFLWGRLSMTLYIVALTVGAGG